MRLRLSLLLWLMAAPATAEPLTVYAAASLRGALDDALAAYDGETPRPVYAGSAALARQIDGGAPADLFISANEAWMDWLAARDRLTPGSRRPLLTNTLVLVSAAEGTIAPDAIATTLGAGDARIAMGLVDAVPAGLYGREALTALGAWEAVAPHVVETANVRVALSLVDRGEVDYAIVYSTDARLIEASIALTFPADSHTPIVYPVAAIAGGHDAEALLAFLAGDAAQAIFAAHGFGRPH